jgi:hypothetical protein
MTGSSFSGSIGFADVTKSTREEETKEVRVDVGEMFTGPGYAQAISQWGPDGYIARPNDPGKEGPDEGACQAMYVQTGNTKRVIGYRDNRYTEYVVDLDEGDRAIVTNSHARIFVKKKRHAVTLFSQGPTGKTMMIDMCGADEVITHVCGETVISQGKDFIMLMVSGGGYLRIDKDGVNMGGARGVLGFAAGSLGAGAVTPGPAGGIAIGVTPGTASATWNVAP